MKIRGGNQDRPSSSAPNLIMLNSMEQTRCIGVGVANSKRETRGVDHVLSEGRRPRPGGPACRGAAPPSAAPHRAGTQQAAGLFSCLTLPWEAKRVSLWRGGNSLLGKTAHACRIGDASPAGPSSTTRVMHVALHLLVTLTRTHSPNRGSMSDQTHSACWDDSRDRSFGKGPGSVDTDPDSNGGKGRAGRRKEEGGLGATPPFNGGPLLRAPSAAITRLPASETVNRPERRPSWRWAPLPGRAPQLPIRECGAGSVRNVRQTRAPSRWG